jgi:hypothetical protein
VTVLRARGRLALIALVGAMALCSPAAATAAVSAKSITKTSGTVSATLSWQQSRDRFGGPLFAGLRLTVTRDDATAYSQAVHSPACGEACELETYKGAPAPLQVVQLEGAGEPDVVIRLYTGGAHCCSVFRFLRWNTATRAYVESEHDFGDPGARIADLGGDGKLELESADDRFAYEFTSFAFSGLPIQIWRLSEGQLVDVTREFPGELAADAARWLHAFKTERRHGLGLGFIAAWAADEELLGHKNLVARTLATEASHHRLRSGDRLTVGGTAFVRKLNGFLRKTGYV